MFPFGVTIPAAVPQGSEIPEGLMSNPVYNASVGENKRDFDNTKMQDTSTRKVSHISIILVPSAN
jgi:hypothetical protein